MKFKALIGTLPFLFPPSVLYGVLGGAVKDAIDTVQEFVVGTVWGGLLMILFGILAVRHQLNSDDHDKELGRYYYMWFLVAGFFGLGVSIVILNLTGEL